MNPVTLLERIKDTIGRQILIETENLIKEENQETRGGIKQLRWCLMELDDLGKSLTEE